MGEVKRRAKGIAHDAMSTRHDIGQGMHNEQHIIDGRRKTENRN